MLVVLGVVDVLLHLGHVDVGNGLVAIEDAGDFLEGGALGLDVEEPDEGGLDKIPESVKEHEVPVLGQVVPRDLVGLAVKETHVSMICIYNAWESTGWYVLANGENSLDGNVHNHHALSTEMEGQDLESVGNEETRETNVVEDTEDPDEDKLGISRAGVGSVGVLVDGTSDGPADESTDHTEDGGQEEGTTTELVDGESGSDGDDQIEDGLAGGDTKLLVLVGDTGTLVDGVHVVGEKSVTGVLGNDTEGDNDGQPPAVALGAEEVEVAGSTVGILLQADGGLDLSELKLDSGVVRVATAVPLREHGKSLLVTVLVDEITRRLGNPPDESELNDGRHNLDEGDGPPRPVVVNTGSTPANAGHNQGTQVPQAIVDGGDRTTVLRMADFGEQQRRSHLSQRVTETENETTTEVHCSLLAETLSFSRLGPWS